MHFTHKKLNEQIYIFTEMANSMQLIALELFSLFTINGANNNSPSFRLKRAAAQQLMNSSPADPCLLKCKDDYMLSTESRSHPAVVPSWRMDSAIGSPLHALIDTIANDNSIERIGAECGHHSKFLTCLEHCGTSIARKILEGGQGSLQTICQSYKTDKEFVNFVLPCLARNGARVGKSCQLHWSLLEKDMFEAMQHRMEMVPDGGSTRADSTRLNDGLRQLCRGMNSYADCHLKTVAQFCHRRALPFFVRLNAKSSAALLQMLADWAGSADLRSAAREWQECAQWELDAASSDARATLWTANYYYYYPVKIAFLWFIGVAFQLMKWIP